MYCVDVGCIFSITKILKFTGNENLFILDHFNLNVTIISKKLWCLI